MIKRIIIALLIICVLASCKRREALKYNQEFVNAEKSLTDDIKSTEEKVGQFAKEMQYDSIAVAGEKMESKIAKVIGEFKTKPAPDAEQGEKFKVDAIKYFEYIKSVYTTYKELGKATTEEARGIIMGDLQTQVGNMKDVLTKIQTSQQEYAKANGFKLEKQ
jgi:hypothetical protein